MELDWPSPIRGAVRRDEARGIAEQLGEELGLAYLLAAYVAECELDAGRGADELHAAASDFCDLLSARAAE